MAPKTPRNGLGNDCSMMDADAEIAAFIIAYAFTP